MENGKQLKQDLEELLICVSVIIIFLLIFIILKKFIFIYIF